MSRMPLLKTTISSSRLLRNALQARGIASLLRDPPRCFSTEAEQPNQDQSVDTFLRNANSGFVYGRLSGNARFTTKSDIVKFLEGCNLSLDDIKVDYNRLYSPLGILIQFPSRSDYDAAVRAIVRKGRLYRLERADRSQWDTTESFDGKAIVIQGIPPNALIDDIERFLHGCKYDATSIQLFSRQAFPDPIRMAVVRFPSQIQAVHAFITKNRGFCLNNQISLRVLQ